jgi:hypothetical protein
VRDAVQHHVLRDVALDATCLPALAAWSQALRRRQRTHLEWLPDAAWREVADRSVLLGRSPGQRRADAGLRHTDAENLVNRKSALKDLALGRFRRPSTPSGLSLVRVLANSAPPNTQCPRK